MQHTSFMDEIPNKIRNIAFTSTDDVDQVMQPLKQYGITHFFYLEYFYDGSFIELSNSGDILEYYYRNVDAKLLKKHVRHYLDIKEKINLSINVRICRVSRQYYYRRLL